MKEIKYLFLIIAISLSPLIGVSQNGTTSAGSTVQSSDYTIAYALGESIVSRYGDGDDMVTNGIIQPHIQIISSSSEIESQDHIIFPNPSSAILNVRSEDKGLSTYEILSIDGKVIKKGRIDNGRIDISYIDEGIYLIKLESPSNTYSTLIQKLHF